MDTPARGPGVYLHIPFCARRCDYCAFTTFTGRQEAIPAYLDAVLQEWAARRAELGGERPATVYVGGGTPSLVPAAALARVIAALDPAPGAEVTVECNPESTTPGLLAALRRAGVTRVSLGVQSIAPHVLAGLGRAHHAGALEVAVEAIGATGFPTYNVDLIYGGAGERDGDLVASLEAVLALDPAPPHISAYALTVEAGTPLARTPERHPDDDVQARRYALCDEILEGAGLEWYEVSNWARPTHECRHNRNYWGQGNYVGLGCAAHSHRDGVRSWNIAHLDRYIAAVSATGAACAGAERLDGPTQARERLELGLRTRDGVPARAFAPADLATLTAAGLLRHVGGRVVLTRRGRLLANEVACRLADPAPAGLAS